MPHYALFLHEDVPAADATSHDEAMQEMVRYAELVQQLRAEGSWVDGAVLMPPTDGRVVQVDQDRATVQEVPVRDRTLGGFLLVDCEDDARALEIAARVPVATHGVVEVRPLFQPPQGMFD